MQKRIGQFSFTTQFLNEAAKNVKSNELVDLFCQLNILCKEVIPDNKVIYTAESNLFELVEETETIPQYIFFLNKKTNKYTCKQLLPDIKYEEMTLEELTSEISKELTSDNNEKSN